MAVTVLVVEDERKLRDLVQSYLERAGFAVLSTGSGAEPITMASGAAPDLVVLDLGLPDVPGEAVARELRAAAATPILMLTAKTTEEDRIRGLELGANDYVTKPFSLRELVLRVQAVLRRGGPAADQGVASYGCRSSSLKPYPPGPLDARAASPPTRQARRHWYTGFVLTRGILAIRPASMSCPASRAACSRTSSRGARPSALSPPPSAYLVPSA